jgi:hypothetical protein
VLLHSSTATNNIASAAMSCYLELTCNPSVEYSPPTRFHKLAFVISPLLRKAFQSSQPFSSPDAALTGDQCSVVCQNGWSEQTIFLDAFSKRI